MLDGTFPRTRGGDPFIATVKTGQTAFSPHTRG